MMQITHVFILMLTAAVFLVYCGDDDDDKAGGGSSTYTLKIGGIGTQVTIGTDLNVTTDIMQGNEAITAGDIASSKVSLAIECGQHKVAEQKDKAATAGKVAFDAITVQGDNFTGNCTATVSSNIGGKAVSVTHTFEVTAKSVIQLPSQSNGGTPITDTAAIVGRPFSIAANGNLKIQPDELCDSNLALIYYDAQNNSVREVHSGGENIAPEGGAVSGLALVKVGQGDIAQVCKDPSDSSLPPSILISVMPGFPAGLRMKVSEASDAPTLTATLIDEGGKVALQASAAAGFDGGADIFFNASMGNRWTKHTGTIDWTAASVKVVSSLDYPSRPQPLIKALVMVKPHGTRQVSHWLYYNSF